MRPGESHGARPEAIRGPRRRQGRPLTIQRDHQRHGDCAGSSWREGFSGSEYARGHPSDVSAGGSPHRRPTAAARPISLPPRWISDGVGDAGSEAQAPAGRDRCQGQV